jgi:response regulator RpfG family c-di-GMP phosphodiesterase
VTTRKKTVLIVDDESMQRAWMRGILRRQGYAVLEAPDYAEALTVEACHVHIDLFLIDLRLPGGSGYDLWGELMAAHPDSKILFVSGATGAEICKYFASPLPAVQFLQKPFEAAQLAARMREIFEPSAETFVASASGDFSGNSERRIVLSLEAARKRQRKC